MEFRPLSIEEKLGKEYNSHPLFEILESYIEFYASLSWGVMNWLKGGVYTFTNIDTYAYSSIQGTLESIFLVLKKGRFNDAYSLLRKFFDATMINIYTGLFLENNFNLENIVVTKISNWVKGKEKLPEYREISRYIKDDIKLKDVTELLKKDDRYKKIRNRCNDYMHYNFYHNMLSNDNEILATHRLTRLEAFQYDLNNIFIQHFAYIFTLHPHYMMSSDYTDYLDVGIKPPDDSQYWVIPSVQNIFDKIVKQKRPDIADYIIANNSTDLK